MQTPRHAESPVVKWREGFARASIVKTVAASACAPGHQRALDESLRIDHRVIFSRAQTLPECPHVAPYVSLPDPAAPAPDRRRNHLAHERMQLRHCRQRFFHYPAAAG